MPKSVIRTDLAPKPLGDYSQAWTVTAGKLIFVSGQVSVDMDGNPVGVGDVAVQARTALDNVRRVLEGAGASMHDVVKTITYVTNMTEYWAKTRGIRKEYFTQDFPASTCFEVKSLSRPEFMVEIEAIAAVD